MITDFWRKISPLARKILIFLPALAIFALIIFVVADNLMNSAKLEITVAPVAAQIKIGEKTYQNGNFKIPPGKYDLTITKKDFATYKENFEIKAGETKKIRVALEQTNGDDYYRKNLDDAMIREGINDAKFDENQQKFLRENPIAKNLPFSSTYWRIDYSASAAGKLDILIITLHMQEPKRENGKILAENYKNAALAKIREFGFKPEDFQIVYRWD